MTDHTTCCCAETLDDLKALSAAYEIKQALIDYYLAFRSAYWAANRDRDELTNALNTAIAERDRARGTAARLEAELARGFHTAAPDITLTRDNDDPATPEAVPREGQEGAESGLSRAADGWSVRDLADELLTLQPVDPARCNPRRKAHSVIGGRELECGECWRERVAERLEQWRRSIEAQEGAENAPSRVADGLAGSDWHSGTPATGEARKSAESGAPFFAPEIGGAW